MHRRGYSPVSLAMASHGTHARPSLLYLQGTRPGTRGRFIRMWLHNTYRWDCVRAQLYVHVHVLYSRSLADTGKRRVVLTDFRTVTNLCFFNCLYRFVRPFRNMFIFGYA